MLKITKTMKKYKIKLSVMEKIFQKLIVSMRYRIYFIKLDLPPENSKKENVD